jgi:uncharacterized protein (TIRG00374 family)
MNITAARLKKLILSALRIAIGLLLAVFLIHLTLKSSDTDLGANLRDARKSLLLLAALLYGISLAIGTWRWHLLLKVQGINLRARDLLRLQMIGFFFNLAIPGAVGGDLVKMGFVARQTAGKRTEAVFSIMVDRIAGMLGLFVVASAMVLLALPFLLSLGPEYRPIQLGAFTVGLGSLAGIIGILAVEFHGKLLAHPWLKRLVEWTAGKLPEAVNETVVRVMTALDQYRKKRALFAATVLISVVIHCFLALDLYLVGRALHDRALSLADYTLTTQVANCVAAVPVTPAGVGTRDFVAKLFFEAMGMTGDKIGAVPVTLTLVIIFWGLVGAGVFTLSPPATPSPVAETGLEDDPPQADRETEH